MSDGKKAEFCAVCGADVGHADNCSAYVEELLAKLDAAKAEAERRAAIDKACVETGCLFVGTTPRCSRCGRYDRTGMQARTDLATALADLARVRAETWREAIEAAAQHLVGMSHRDVADAHKLLAVKFNDVHTDRMRAIAASVATLAHLAVSPPRPNPAHISDVGGVFCSRITTFRMSAHIRPATLVGSSVSAVQTHTFAVGSVSDSSKKRAFFMW